MICLQELASKFLDGSLDVEGFLEQFTSRRKQMHLRKVKADKMTEMVQKRTFASPAANRTATSNFYSPPPALAPYPMAPMPAMPMPTMFATPNHFGWHKLLVNTFHYIQLLNKVYCTLLSALTRLQLIIL